MNVVEFRAVTKRYGSRTALAPLDLEFETGRTYVLIGPSGCGKSTFVKLMIGLVRPDAGEVVFEDQKLTPENVLDIRRRVGYVIQDGGLFPHLTARQNITLVANYLGWSTERSQQRLAELTELTRLPADALDRYPQQLSGGQRQRVGLMRALILDPHLLLLDEPLGALDPMIRADLQTDLRDVFRSLQKTVVLVTHDLSEAAYFADEIILLSDGKVVQRGAVSDLLDSPSDPFVTRFVNAQRTTLLDSETSEKN